MEKFKQLVFSKPVLGFAAYSGSGKTSLLVKLLPILKARGLRIAVIKQTHHDFDIDKPGKDSYKIRKAGANQMLIASEHRYALVTEHDKPAATDLLALVNKLDLNNLDLVLVEGFKTQPFPKIEIHRAAAGNKLIFPEDSHIIAVVSDEKIDTAGLPLVNLNVTEDLAAYIFHWLASE